jgi:hypothetical protein
MDHADSFTRARWFTPGRPGAVSLVVLHSTEGPNVTGSAGAVAGYFGAAPIQASAHVTVDDYEAAGSVDWTDTAWHAGKRVINDRSIGIEHCGYASWGRGDWLAHRATIERSAAITGALCARYDIPAMFLTVDQLAAGAAGICTHADVTAAYRVPGGHVDPGPGFPRDVWLSELRRWTHPTEPPPAPTKGARMLACTVNADGRAEEFRISTAGKVLHRWQLTAGGKWSQYLDMGSPGAVDQVAAFTNADGRAEVIAMHSAFGAIFRTYQTKPGGPWSPWAQD